jgi:vitamin B12 transporter
VGNGGSNAPRSAPLPRLRSQVHDIARRVRLGVRLRCATVFRLPAVAALGLLFSAGAATAGAVENTEGDGPAALVVTATRTATETSDSIVPITTLDLAQIEARQVISVPDLFAGEAGVQLTNNGGLGKETSVYLRGSNADQVLVLIDGVRVGSTTVGATAFQYLPLESIDHVEIVRGPLSSLYGSEAMGGVIQIFTRHAAADGVTVDAQASEGSHETSLVGGSFGGRSGPFSIELGGSNIASNGYQNCTGAPYVSPSSPGGGCFVYDPTPDGFHSVSGNARVHLDLPGNSDIEGIAMRAQGGTRYAGEFTNHEDFVEQVATIAAHIGLTDTLRLTAQVGQSRDDEVDTLNFVESPGSLFDTIRTSASLQADWKPASSTTVTFGSDYLHDQIASDTVFPVTVRDVTGVFAELQEHIGPAQFTLSGRNDSNSQFGDRATGGAGFGYRLADDLKLTAVVGTAFHAPSFNDLYFPQFGNPDLKPESSVSYDLGIERRSAADRWSVHAFQSLVHDLIGYDAILFAPENTDRARIAGVEFDASLTRGPWKAGLNATWLDARDVTPDSPNYGKLLPRRARGTGRLELSRAIGRFSITTRIDAAGPRYDDIANTQPLGGYTTVDVLGEMSIGRHWTLQAKLANATDRRYETALYYPQDGRNYLITLRYGPARD